VIRAEPGLLRHAIPSGDPAQIFARALDVLIEQLVTSAMGTSRCGRGHTLGQGVGG
jgi:hypothetical protein